MWQTWLAPALPKQSKTPASYLQVSIVSSQNVVEIKIFVLLCFILMFVVHPTWVPHTSCSGSHTDSLHLVQQKLASKVTSLSPESGWNAWNSQSTVGSQEASETRMILSNPFQVLGDKAVQERTTWTLCSTKSAVGGGILKSPCYGVASTLLLKTTCH